MAPEHCQIGGADFLKLLTRPKTGLHSPAAEVTVHFLSLLRAVMADIVREDINLFLPVRLVERLKVLNEAIELTFIADGQQK
jgi:hypothetical protein